MLAGVALDGAEDCDDDEGRGDDDDDDIDVMSRAVVAAADGGVDEVADSWAAVSFSAASSFSKFRRNQSRVNSSPSVPFSAHKHITNVSILRVFHL